MSQRRRRRSLKLPARSSQEAFPQSMLRNGQIEGQPSLAFTRHTMGSTKPVGIHFGKALCNQHLKQPSDTINLSGIPQGFSLLWQQLKNSLRRKLVCPMREEPTTFQQFLHLMKCCMLVSSVSPDCFTFYISHFDWGKIKKQANQTNLIFPSPLVSNTANVQPVSSVSCSSFPCSYLILF